MILLIYTRSTCSAPVRLANVVTASNLLSMAELLRGDLALGDYGVSRPPPSWTADELGKRASSEHFTLSLLTSLSYCNGVAL